MFTLLLLYLHRIVEGKENIDISFLISLNPTVCIYFAHKHTLI